MRTVRKRQILKIMKPRAVKMLIELESNETALACFGRSIMSREKEDQIFRALSGYAAILERNNMAYGTYKGALNDYLYWKCEVMNHL